MPAPAAGIPDGSEHLPGWSYAARARRYVLAAAGPIAVAGANFLLSFSMLRLEAPHAFGVFTFLFAAALFMIALSGALFGAPMQALFGEEGERRDGVVATVAGTALAAGLIALPLFALLGLALGLRAAQAACYGLFAMLTILRSVGRAWCYAVERPWRVTIADISYAAVTLGSFAGAVGLGHVAPGDAVYPALALSGIAALAGVGRQFGLLLWRSRGAPVRGYGAIWRDQSRWSLLGVAATEASANAHIYLLTLLSGAAAVAPVAASALLLRPINVIQNALVEYERPQIARFLSVHDLREVDRSVRLFRAVLLLMWLGTAVLAAAILLFDPSLIFPASYDPGTVRLGVSLWAGVMLAIVVQVPLNVLLQAGGEFRALARAGLAAAVVSVAGVLLAIAAAAPMWTVAAIGLGWLTSLGIVLHTARGFRRSLSGTGTAV